EAERRGADWKRRLLAHARLEVGVRPAQALGDPPRHAADLPLERVVHRQLPSGDPGEDFDRTVVVRRAEAAGDDAEVGAEAFSERRLELVRPVADDRDPRRLEPEPKRLAGEERAVP